MPHVKLFAVMTALALTPAALAQEAVTEQVFLEADTLTDDQENGQMIAEGNVVARYGGRQLLADRLIYNLETQKVRAIGNVRILNADGSIQTADEIEVDETLGDGVASEFTAQLPENAIVVARAATRVEGGSNALDYAIYTACEICEEEGSEPTWTLRARKAVQDNQAQMISYRDAIFEIKGVPVLYLPYFSHADPSSERRSGLLTPKPELSSKLGAVYEQPYYWSISPSQDLVITPKLYTNVNSALDLNYRKRFYSGALEIDTSMTYEYEFDSNGDRQFYNTNGRVIEDPENFNGILIPSEEKFRGHIFAEGLFNFDETWKWGFAVENVTDDLYLRRYSIPGTYKARGLLDSDPQRLLNQVFAIGQTDTFYTDISAYSVQGLQNGDNDGAFARVAPLGYADKVYDFGNFGISTLQVSVASLDRSEGNDTRRVSAIADWENAYVAPAGLVLEPLLRVRTDYYDYSIRETNLLAGFKDSQSRNSALAAATLRYPFIRRGQNSTITVEPVVTVAYGEADVENGALPVEDSLFFEYDLPALFEADPFNQYDLIEQGGRIAAGMRVNAALPNDISVNGTFGRRWREQEDPFFSVASNLDGTVSDYLVGSGFKYRQNFSFNTSLRIDDDFNLQRIEMQSSLNWWRLRSNVTYFSLSEDISFTANDRPTEGVILSAQFRLTDSIDLSYQIERNLEQNLNREQQFAVRWSDDCSFFLVGYRQNQINDRGVGDSDTIVFGFGFNTLGEVSNVDFE